jgi:hypothetical protein
MMQRILNSKNLVAFVLAAATGMTLYFRMPFPEGNIFLRVMALRSPFAFEVLKYSHTLFLFSTPYIGYSLVFSGLYIFCAQAATIKGHINRLLIPVFGNLAIGDLDSERVQSFLNRSNGSHCFPRRCPLFPLAHFRIPFLCDRLAVLREREWE